MALLSKFGILGALRNMFTSNEQPQQPQQPQEQQFNPQPTVQYDFPAGPTSPGRIQDRLLTNVEEWTKRAIPKYTPLNYGGVGGGGSSYDDYMAEYEQRQNKQEEIYDAIDKIASQFGQPAELRSFDFDEAAARLRSEARFDPYFTEKMNDYLNVVGIERRRKKEDYETASKRAQQQQDFFFKKEDREALLNAIAQRRSERMRGLQSSGVAESERGFQGVLRKENLDQATQSFQQSAEDRALSQKRYEETSSLEEELKRRDIGRAREASIASDVQTQREQEQQEYDKSVANQIADLDSQRQSQINMGFEKLRNL